MRFTHMINEIHAEVRILQLTVTNDNVRVNAPEVVGAFNRSKVHEVSK